MGKDLITKLLERDPKKRLGSTDSDIKEIQRHPFFKNIDWDKLYKREIEAPYKPNVKGIDDTSNFDDMFLKEAWSIPMSLRRRFMQIKKMDLMDLHLRQKQEH